MEFYIGHRTPQPQPTVSPPAVLPPVLVPSPRLPPRDKVVDVFSPTPRDKVVSVLLPSPVRQVLEPSIENLVMPQMNQVPQSDVSPSVLPTPISLMNEPDVIPAFDQLAVSTGVSTGVCSVASGEIPNFNSLLNVESTSQAVDDH